MGQEAAAGRMPALRKRIKGGRIYHLAGEGFRNFPGAFLFACVSKQTSGLYIRVLHQ